MSQPQLILLYHFFHPDDVISARLFSEIAQRLAADGWQVTAIPAARWFESNEPLPKREQWQAVDIRRVWRPKLKQSSNLGRVVNALVMLLQWTCALRSCADGQEKRLSSAPILSCRCW